LRDSGHPGVFSSPGRAADRPEGAPSIAGAQERSLKMTKLDLRARAAAAALLALGSVVAACAQPAPPSAPRTPPLAAADQVARFLAGLPVDAASPLAALEQTPEWKDHARRLDEDWNRLAERLGKMSAWSAAEFPPTLARDANVLYFFGGPDFVSAQALFPDAKAYLLCGLEPVGEVAPPERLKPAALVRSLDNLRSSLRSEVMANFFRTDEMAHDLRVTEVKGVLPILYLFLARGSAHLEAVQRVEIDAAGTLREVTAGQSPGGGTAGVRIRFRREGHEAAQDLYYFRVDLGNEALRKNPGFLAFARTLAPANAFLKAASFILHNKLFSDARTFLLENSAAVLQDDSGIPFHAFPRSAWEFSCYGRYLKPKPPFQKAYQTDLATAFATRPPGPLSFTVGYRKPSESNLLLAVKKSSVATQEAKPANRGTP
jgi:hypothetical protein